MPRISDLPALASTDSGDLVPVVDVSTGITKKVTVGGLSGSGGGTWGDITGTLADQTDLQSALDATGSPLAIESVPAYYDFELGASYDNGYVYLQANNAPANEFGFLIDVGGYLALAGNSTIATPGTPVSTDSVDNYFQFLADETVYNPGVNLLGEMGFVGETDFSNTNWIQGGDMYWGIDQAGVRKYPLWVDNSDNAVWIQQLDFKIGSGGGFGARPTSYITFDHDGTDLNIVGTSTTDVNFTGITDIKLNGASIAGNGDALYSVLASTATGDGAELIGVEDAAAHWDSNTVEDVLEELQDNIDLVATTNPTTVKFKTADELRNNTTGGNIQAVDTDLYFTSLAAASTYVIEGYVQCESPTGVGMSVAMAISESLVTGEWAMNVHQVSSSTNYGYQNLINGVARALETNGDPTPNSTGEQILHIKGHITTNATLTSNLGFEWLQTASSATNVGTKRGSWIKLTKVA